MTARVLAFPGDTIAIRNGDELTEYTMQPGPGDELRLVPVDPLDQFADGYYVTTNNIHEAGEEYLGGISDKPWATPGAVLIRKLDGEWAILDPSYKPETGDRHLRYWVANQGISPVEVVPA